jgi:hypothetical protein
MKIADNVAGGVEAFHRCLLVRVDSQIAYAPYKSACSRSRAKRSGPAMPLNPG